MKTRFSTRSGKWGCSAMSMLAGAVISGVFAGSAWAAAYTLGDLNLQNGWDGGIDGVPFTSNWANSNVIENTGGVAFAGSQYWRLSGSYSAGIGTPQSPYVATVGAPNATSVFGAPNNSPFAIAGDQSVISFAFKAVAPGDGSRLGIYEADRGLPPAHQSRTGTNIYLVATSAGLVTISNYQLSSTDSCGNQDFPSVTLATVAADTWHTVKMTTTYPNIIPADLTTYGTTTYVIDEGTPGQVTVTDNRAAWVHPYNYCVPVAYSPGNALWFGSSFNDYPTHQGFYLDNVSMKVNNTATNTTVGSFFTGFEASEMPYTVTYSGNGSTGGSVPTDSFTHVPLEPVTLLAPGDLTKAGYSFAGWNTAADGSGTSYAGTDNIVMGSGDITLYAIWTSPASIPTLSALMQVLLTLLVLGFGMRHAR
jgi:uncharacterized repeat protein (TIGR02543 family)